MHTSSFDYPLPPRAIAQPPARRDRSRMLVLHRTNGRTEHRTIRDLPAFLQRGDLIVVNDTKVFRARLRAVVECHSGGAPSPPVRREATVVEILLIRPSSPVSSRESPRAEGSRSISEWTVLAKPARRLRVGAIVAVGRMRGTVLGHESDGSVRIQFDRSAAAVIAHANRIGEIPTPPYVSHGVQRLADYQTTYARHTGSVAAPTAGFHITPRLLRALNKRGVRIARITLHVGLGTFQPIRTETLEDHMMHAEWVSIPATTARAITSAKSRGSRVVAIGTTTLRALEGVALVCHPEAIAAKDVIASPRSNLTRCKILRGVRLPRCGLLAMTASHIENFSGPINIFITPGYHFRIVNALLTNFHLPRSTLLVLVSAFVAPGDQTLRGRDTVLRAYRSALRHGYRFYSFGDAMFIE